MISEDILLRKINKLPPGKIDEVIDFVDFLMSRDDADGRTERTASIAAFATEFGGSGYDLDEELENSGIENLVSFYEAPR